MIDLKFIIDSYFSFSLFEAIHSQTRFPVTDIYVLISAYISMNLIHAALLNHSIGCIIFRVLYHLKIKVLYSHWKRTFYHAVTKIF